MKGTSLQKSVGLQAMHALLVTVLEYVRSVGDSVIELSSYKKALKTALLELEGDTSRGELSAEATSGLQDPGVPLVPLAVMRCAGS